MLAIMPKMYLISKMSLPKEDSFYRFLLIGLRVPGSLVLFVEINVIVRKLFFRLHWIIVISNNCEFGTQRQIAKLKFTTNLILASALIFAQTDIVCKCSSVQI